MRASQRLSQSSQHAEVYLQRTAIRFDPIAITLRDVEYSVPLPPVSLEGGLLAWTARVLEEATLFLAPSRKAGCHTGIACCCQLVPACLPACLLHPPLN